MTAGWAVLWFIVTLMFLVFIHEMGHFITAKWRGVKVLEFGIGMPPRIWGKQRGETMYSLNWIPIGGFCKMMGEEDPSEPGSLASKDPWSRLLVLSAGSLVMLIFPLILFPVIYMVPHDVVVGGEDITVRYVEENTPAYHAGILEGDLILEINGEVVRTYDDMSEVMGSVIGSEITMLIERESVQIELTMLARSEDQRPADQGAVGIGLYYQTVFTESESYTPLSLHFGVKFL
jgi:regulator of sigma E protease